MSQWPTISRGSGRRVRSGWYAFILSGVIFYGIFSGRLAPTEAGTTAVVITMIMGFILRTLKLSDFPGTLVSSAKVNGVILPIIAFSLPLAQALAILGVPQGFVAAATSVSDEPWIIILMMIGFLIVAGCVMETTPNIVILSPILKPLTDNIGMNEIQFCIMMITALGIGFITPPLGLNLFVVSGLTGESILKIAHRGHCLCLLQVGCNASDRLRAGGLDHAASRYLQVGRIHAERLPQESSPPRPQ